MKPKIEIIESKLFAGTVADEIAACLGEAISEKGEASLVLSGGSTPAAVYRALSTPPRVNEVDWAKLTIFWGDERWVARSDNQSNYKMAQETLISKIKGVTPKLIAPDTSIASAQKGAADYEQALRAWAKSRGDSHVQFDLVLLGMGDDGHTASIFPNSKLPSAEALCFAVKNPYDGSERVSLTPQALFGARRIIFIVTGENKAEMVQKVFAEEGTSQAIPARLFETAADRVTWFLDTGASLKIR